MSLTGTSFPSPSDLEESWPIQGTSLYPDMPMCVQCTLCCCSETKLRDVCWHGGSRARSVGTVGVMRYWQRAAMAFSGAERVVGWFFGWYSGIVTRWCGDIVIWWYGGMVIWWYSDMVMCYCDMVMWWCVIVIWWCGGMVMCYCDMVVWWYSDMVMCYCDMVMWWHGDVLLWYGDVVIWWNGDIVTVVWW